VAKLDVELLQLLVVDLALELAVLVLGHAWLPVLETLA
jgi:hypothetical protein